MPRSTKPIEQRIDEKDSEIQKYLDKAKQLQEQKKLLEKQKKEADRKARTKRLIEIGASVESVLGRDFRDGDNIRLMNFLKAQERNGKYFTKAMDKVPDKGALIYGRSPYCISFSLRLNRSDSKRVCRARSVGGSYADSTKGALPFWISRKDASLLDLDHFMETRFHLEGVKTCSLNNPPMPHKIIRLCGFGRGTESILHRASGCFSRRHQFLCRAGVCQGLGFRGFCDCGRSLIDCQFNLAFCFVIVFVFRGENYIIFRFLAVRNSGSNRRILPRKVA